MSKLYKYLSPNLLSLVMSRQGYVSVKCSYPKDYNDPYELSLSIDFEENSSLLAFYLDTVEKIPQRPTSCFSKSPSVTPMWAHYAKNASGFVIEFDEEKLKERIKDISINDIEYMDAPSPHISDCLHRAFATCKPRHTMFFYDCVTYYAYFSKQTCWGYEQERRIIIDEDSIEDMLLYIPQECISAIIVGPKADAKLMDSSHVIASKLGCKHYRMVIGKSTVTPFFISASEQVSIFNGDRIVLQDYVCQNCNEPLKEDQSLCAWCKISGSDKQEAASRNPMRMLASMNSLSGYIESFYKIRK